MPARKIFEELGLTGQDERPNPYSILGLDPALAQELIREDPSGEAVRLVSGALSRVLSARYHPDKRRPKETARDIVDIQDARQRINKASPASLARWADIKKSPAAAKLKEQEEKLKLITSVSAQMFEAQVESTENPNHFSNFDQSDGILVRTRTASFLLRPQGDGKSKLVQGVPRDYMSDPQGLLTTRLRPEIMASSLFADKDYLGVGEDRRLLAFIEGPDKMHVYDDRFNFLSDESELRADRLRAFESLPRFRRNNEAFANYWLRNTESHLVSFVVPAKGQLPKPLGIMEFNDTKKGAKWEVPALPVGSLADTNFADEMTRGGSNIVEAIESQQQKKYLPFSMGSFAVSLMIERSAGYSPLIEQGSSLLVYDRANHIPVATDFTILGMLAVPRS